MSITNLPSLDRTAATFRDDVDTFFATSLPAFTSELNAEITRINGIGVGAYSTTSTTSLTIGTGSKSLTVETGKSFVAGQPVMVASTASPTLYMVGQVTAYNSGTGAMTVDVTSTQGSGTIAAWTVSVTALQSVSNVGPQELVVLTSGTSWTCPAGYTRARLRMVGAGGSGARGDTSNSPRSGGGGGAGVEAVFSVSPGTSYSYTIGTGGAAITLDSTNGNPGGNSTFVANSITYTANGGAGGSNTTISAATASGTGAATYLGGLPEDMGGSLAYGRKAGGLSIFGLSGGYGSISGANSGAGYDGKIILELYK